MGLSQESDEAMPLRLDHDQIEPQCQQSFRATIYHPDTRMLWIFVQDPQAYQFDSIGIHTSWQAPVAFENAEPERSIG